ncbi:SDR family NAD(P)-dependent oxidoreductase [Streptomyces wedmorensis]
MGRGVARALAARGADLVPAARTERTLVAVAGECEQRGGRVLVVPTGVGDEAAVQVLVRRAVERSGHVDAWTHDPVPGLYDRLIGRVVNAFAVRGTPGPSHDGTLSDLDPCRARSTTDGVGATIVSSAGLLRWLRAWQHSRSRRRFSVDDGDERHP